MQQKDKTLFVSVLIILVVHTAGIAGLHTAYRELFLAATPFNLLLSIFLLLLNHKEFNSAFLLFAACTALLGYFTEVAGVHTGMIFGNYHYEGTLGFRYWETPLIIGINWLMLVYCAGVLGNRLKGNVFVKSLCGAILLVALDLLIEPVAGRYGFWSFAGNTAPFQNYAAWFVVSILLLLLFHSLKFNKENRFAPALLFVQFLFFASLCLF